MRVFDRLWEGLNGKETERAERGEGNPGRDETLPDKISSPIRSIPALEEADAEKVGLPC
jgi:hypothetical protein